MSNQINSIQENIDSLKLKSQAQDKKIQKLEKYLTDIDDQCEENKGFINIIRQKEVDSNVMVTGFTSKPEAIATTKLICGIYGFNNNKVKTCYSFQNPMNGYFLVITFNSKTDHIKFNTKKREFGPILNKEVNSSISYTDHSKLSIYNMLTSENYKIQKGLQSLLKRRSIAAIKFRNCCFHAQITPYGPKLPVTTTGQLEALSFNNRFKFMSQRKLKRLVSNRPYQNCIEF